MKASDFNKLAAFGNLTVTKEAPAPIKKLAIKKGVPVR